MDYHVQAVIGTSLLIFGICFAFCFLIYTYAYKAENLKYECVEKNDRIETNQN